MTRSIAALLLAGGAAAAAEDRLVTFDVRVVGASPISLGARAGLRLGPIEPYGGVDFFAGEPALDDQVSSHTLPVVAGVRAYVLQAGTVDLFGSFDATLWEETIHASYTELHRRLLVLLGVRSRPAPFFFDVGLGPGVEIRRWPASGTGDGHFAWGVQGAVGVSF